MIRPRPEMSLRRLHRDPGGDGIGIIPKNPLGSGIALEFVGPQGFIQKESLNEVGCDVADDDGVGKSGAFDSGSDVGCLTNDGQFFQGVPTPPSLPPPLARCGCRCGPSALSLSLILAGRSARSCPLVSPARPAPLVGVVFMGLGVAKIDQHSIA